MELSTIFRLLVARKWVLLVLPIVAAALAYVFSLNAPKKYRSSTVLSTGFTTNEGIQITEERVDLWAAGVKFDNMIQKMNSEQVMALLSYHLMIHDLTDANPFRDAKLGKNEKALTSVEKAKMAEVYKSKLEAMEMLNTFDEADKNLVFWMERYGYAGWMLKKDLSIKRTGSTDFVEVSFVSENPKLSAFLVNKLSEEFIRFDSSLKSNNSSESVKFFADIAAEKKKIVDDKATFLERFKSSNNVSGQEFTELKSTQLVSYELLRQEKADEIIAKQLQLSNVEKQLKAFGSEAPTDSRETGEKIIQIRAKINELNQIYVSNGSSDKQLEETINNLRVELQKEMNKMAVSDPSQVNAKLSKDALLAKKSQLELELQIAQNSLSSLEITINNLKGSVFSSASKKSTIESLEKELERANDEYLKAVEKYNTEKNKSLISQSSVKISQMGQPNGSPESSKRVLIIAMAYMATLAMCVFVIIGLEFIDQRLKTPSKFQAYCDLKLLGWINLIDAKNLDLKSLFKSGVNTPDTESFKQYLRKVRFEIENSNAKVLLVTSTKASEGKTFIILSLAYSLSLLNKRTLIIDTNFRNNSLSQLLIAPANFQKMLQEDGQIKLLTGRAGDEPGQRDGANNIISRTSDSNIDVIGSNSGPESPSEILAGRDFVGMLQQLRNHYDYIIMEGASLNQYSDSKELLSYADKVIAIFSAESSLSAADRESIEFMKSLNGAFLGAILNKVDMKNVA
ncbi:MAG: AAA family ATPase [Bacteroidetes bacterium]|nr:AAA family ATPase [Bacteroidota bacterium]